MHDLETGQSTNLRLARSACGGAGFFEQTYVFSVSEPGQDADLNGDGDSADDSVIHVHDLATRITTNLTLAGDLEGCCSGERAVIRLQF